MKPLPESYDHKNAEKRWQSYWLQHATYAWDETALREETFVIDTPPPTVSGLLHMGHIFSYTQADFVARYQRMAGKSVFYPMGFDDNGLPTERLVEKVKKVRATEMSREAFTALCESVAEEARAEFRELFHSVALSIDWNQEYHTISDEAQKLSQMSFLDLYRKGHAYRELKPFFWDPVDQTAIAQAEIEDKELPSQFVDIRFEIVDGIAGAVPPHQSSHPLQSPHPLPLADARLPPPLAGEGRGGSGKEGEPRRNVSEGGRAGGNGEEINGASSSEAQSAKEEAVTGGGGLLAIHNSQFAALSQMEREHVVIGTTRPELIPACVGVFYHPDDARYRHLRGKFAVTPLFGQCVPILEDDTVEPEKGTGIMMCCTFGDEKDIEKWRRHKLETRLVLNKYGKLDESLLRQVTGRPTRAAGSSSSLQEMPQPRFREAESRHDTLISALANKKVSNPDPKNPGAREIIIGLLNDAGLLVQSKPIIHAVKCAERSGAPLEILPTQQWFVRILDKKDALKEKAAKCDWKPAYMKVRIDQWIDGLNSDWCISRQRYFGVPFPAWYVRKGESHDFASETPQRDGSLPTDETPYRRYSEHREIITATLDQLPLNPLTTFPSHRFPESHYVITPYPPDLTIAGSSNNAPTLPTPSLAERSVSNGIWKVANREDGQEFYLVEAEKDVMDTWATSSVSPQLSSKGITKELCLDAKRHAKLFPADIRPQAHEIIRTWAFYTIVKAHLHEDSIPWKHLMISGWCLAADKSKMSKSKGNVVTPVALIEEKGADAVRYWASTSRLGADTAFSEDLLKIGRKLVTKLWNATQFASINLAKLSERPATAAEDAASGRITETLDRWVLARLHRTVEKATLAFDAFEYADARAATEDFFWNDFCDNYLELVKARAYGEASGQPTRSALFTLHHCLNAILKLFAPFVPHITEELFSHVFDREYATAGSVHARGNWPQARDFPSDAAAEKAGIACVGLLNAVRKAKSERNLSIKFPLEKMIIAPGGADGSVAPAALEGTFHDLREAGSVREIQLQEMLPQNAEVRDTEDRAWRLALEFAAPG